MERVGIVCTSWMLALNILTFCSKNASIAYGAQKAWLLNDSLKRNVLFGKQLDDEK